MDARFPCHYLNDRRVLRLSPEALRLFVFATAWSVTNQTDGMIERGDLAIIPTASPQSAVELSEAGLWTAVQDGWIVSDFADTQTSKAQLDGLKASRRADADRAARYRRKKKTNAEPTFADDADESRDASRDSSRDLSRDDKGKARQGKERQGLEEEPAAVTWPTATIPGAAGDSVEVDESGEVLPAPGTVHCASCANPLHAPDSIALGRCRKCTMKLEVSNAS